MTDRTPKNLVASIHQRLLNVSRQSSRAFNDLVMHYAIERFLYRLSQSPHADRIVLKGGLMINVWSTSITRVTRDIDLLAKLSNDLNRIVEVVQHVCEVAVEDDGLVFDPKTVTAQRITEDAEYEGVRVTFRGHFGKMPLAMQIDFGFSDVITPAPILITYPSVLGHPPPKLMAYNRETAIAEKFEAMVKIGELNSRMRDFFDVWILAQTFDFDGPALKKAIASTFARRETALEVDPVCFETKFTQSSLKASQWKGFLKTARVDGAPGDFADVVSGVRDFLQPVIEALVKQQNYEKLWPPGGPWQ